MAYFKRRYLHGVPGSRPSQASALGALAGVALLAFLAGAPTCSLAISMASLRRGLSPSPWQAPPRREISAKVCQVHQSLVQVSMGDEEILQRLYERYGWQSIDCGAGGDSLFLAAAPQLVTSDVAALPKRSAKWKRALRGVDLKRQWKSLSLSTRAQVLRRVALLDEHDFVQHLEDMLKHAEPVPFDVQSRAAQLFKDMAKEFIMNGLMWCKQGTAQTTADCEPDAVDARVQELARENDVAETLSFVARNAGAYFRTLKCEGRWAGKSEMSALASALGRPFVAYGNDWASGDGVEVEPDEYGGSDILPFFKASVGGDAEGRSPVRVFQLGGRGQYQMLGHALGLCAGSVARAMRVYEEARAQQSYL